MRLWRRHGPEACSQRPVCDADRLRVSADCTHPAVPIHLVCTCWKGRKGKERTWKALRRRGRRTRTMKSSRCGLKQSGDRMIVPICPSGTTKIHCTHCARGGASGCQPSVVGASVTQALALACGVVASPSAVAGGDARPVESSREQHHMRGRKLREAGREGGRGGRGWGCVGR